LIGSLRGYVTLSTIKCDLTVVCAKKERKNFFFITDVRAVFRSLDVTFG
jgi:hypothetical protein